MRSRARARDGPRVDTIAFGDLFLADVRAYREAMLARLGWRGRVSAVGRRHARVSRSASSTRGYRAILSCVDTQQLDAAFCGRDFDAALLADLPATSIRAARTASSTPACTRGPLWRADRARCAASACCATSAFSTST